MVMIDLDGTLIDTVPDLVVAANRMLADFGRPVRDSALLRSWVGNGMLRFVKRALTGEMQAEPEPKLFEQALALFRRHYATAVSDLSRPYPGAVDALARLQDLGFALACVTNKAESFTMPLLKNLGLSHYFKLVLSGDSLPAQKPDPLPLRYACEYFGIAPTQAVFVGDSTNDVLAARAAGMPVICVTYGYNHGQSIRESHPDALVDSLLELPTYLRLDA
jgi:phosphoglycolate phosphatase